MVWSYYRCALYHGGACGYFSSFSSFPLVSFPYFFWSSVRSCRTNDLRRCMLMHVFILPAAFLGPLRILTCTPIALVSSELFLYSISPYTTRFVHDNADVPSSLMRLRTRLHPHARAYPRSREELIRVYHIMHHPNAFHALILFLLRSLTHSHFLFPWIM